MPAGTAASRLLPAALTDEYRRRRSSGVTCCYRPQAKTWRPLPLRPARLERCGPTLGTNLTQEPGTGGPAITRSGCRRSISTPAPHDRRRAFWSTGRYYSRRSAVAQDPEHRARSALRLRRRHPRLRRGGSEGRAAGSPTRRCCSARGGVPEGGWAPTVADGGFTTTTAPQRRAAPWYIYEFTPDDAYASPPKSPRRHPVDLLTLSWRHERDRLDRLPCAGRPAELWAG